MKENIEKGSITSKLVICMGIRMKKKKWIKWPVCLLVFCTSVAAASQVKASVTNKVLRTEAQSSIVQEEMDLVIFMGQSNMSGRGDSSKAPKLERGAGYEFRSVSDPTKLYTIEEPFGFYENKEGGLNEPSAKKGSLVTSFVNQYYKRTQVPIVGVCATKGASGILEWAAGSDYYKDALERYKTADAWLNENGFKIRHRYMVWLQGEYDAAVATPSSTYTETLKGIVDGFQEAGVEQCMIIRIGETTENDYAYDELIRIQTELCRTDKDFVLISAQAAVLPELEMMVDTEEDKVHWTQSGYNLVGEEAGHNLAEYVLTGEEPIIEDPEYGNFYIPE